MENKLRENLAWVLATVGFFMLITVDYRIAFGLALVLVGMVLRIADYLKTNIYKEGE